MEAPIIRTCNALALLALTSAACASPALAQVSDEQRRSLFVAARTADMLGDADRAAQLYAQLVSSAPVDAQIEARAAAEAIAAGRFDLARAIGRDSSAPQSTGLDLRLLMLADALRAGDHAGATALLEDDDARVPLGFLEPFVRAWIEGTTGRGQGIARLAAIEPQRPLARQVDEQAALLALATDRVELALERIDPALSRAGPREARLRLAFAEGLHRVGRPDLATSLLAGEDAILVAARERLADGEALGMTIDTPAEALSELLLSLAIDLTQGQNNALPIGMAQVARAADPENDAATIIAGAMLERDERIDEALDLYASIDPASPLALQAEDSRIQLLVTNERAEEALAIARAARERDPDRPGAWARIADALAALDRHGEAAAAYARERADGDVEWPILFLEAVARNEAGDWASAKALLEQAMAMEADSAVLLNYLGYMMLENGDDVDLASAYIRKAARLEPDSAAITDSLGWALFKLGDTNGALEALEAAATNAPADPEIHEHYGDALYRAGSRIEARFAWEAALFYAEADEARTRIEDKLAYGLQPSNAAP